MAVGFEKVDDRDFGLGGYGDAVLPELVGIQVDLDGVVGMERLFEQLDVDELMLQTFFLLALLEDQTGLSEKIPHNFVRW